MVFTKSAMEATAAESLNFSREITEGKQMPWRRLNLVADSVL